MPHKRSSTRVREPRRAAQPMHRARRGFTVTELAIVLVVAGSLLGMAYPRMREATGAAALRSAKQEVMASLTQARAAAVEQGRRSVLTRSGNTLQVTVESNGAQTAVGGALDLYGLHAVSLDATVNSIAFDPRGYAIGLGGVEVIRLTRGALRDSVCVTRAGRLATVECGL
jgi:prepilin-type N-terminal cleavage/methylation domain-containing protein